jgi:AbrB family looped-hinge helix DNA binding protein
MDTTSVTSKGQVTIPLKIRQQLGIRKGSKVSFVLTDDHIELRVKEPLKPITDSGFGMLKSRRKKAIPADFDVANLLKES